MARPIVGTFTEEWYAQLEPVQYAEVQHDYPLLRFLNAMGLNFQEIEDYSTELGSEIPWSLLIDVDRSPLKALPYLAQFVGVRFPTGLTEAQQRQRIKDAPNLRRGSPAAMVAAAQTYLTGNKTVILRERYLGNAYRIQVTTYTSQTPSQAIVETALRSQKPGGIILEYQVMPGQDWQTLVDTRATWQVVINTYPTWDSVINDTPGI